MPHASGFDSFAPMASNSFWSRLARDVLAPIVKNLLSSGQKTGGSSPSGTPRAGGRGASSSPRPGGRGAAQRGSVRPGGTEGRDRSQATTPSDLRVDAAEAARRGAVYPGDYSGPLRPEYSPAADGDADPGEIVWAWVPYEEDHSQGKDRPVLLVGRDGTFLLALMLTSKDHTRERDADYIDIGSGSWDARGRPSEVKLDRVIRVEEGSIRREGSILDRARFESVAAALAARR